MPFLRNVTSGRNVPDERLASVAEHYYAAGGASPINEQNIALIKALTDDLRAKRIDLPVYWGNRNWHPLLTDTLREMAADGKKHAVAFVTSAFSSYSGCRQYRDDIARAQAEVGPAAPVVDKVRQYFNHPGFIETMAANVQAALSEVTPDAHLVFTAHSIPSAMAANSRYQSQLREAAALVVNELGVDNRWDVVYQSRSGSPHVAWLEPDVNDFLRTLEASSAVLIPIGFVSDHMEVIYDLDNEARETARKAGLPIARAATVGADPKFVSMITELVEEHLATEPVRRALGTHGVVGCAGVSCCLPA